MQKFILSCESTVDLPYSWAQSRNISVLFYHYLMNDQTIEDDMGRDPTAPVQFYTKLRKGETPLTSQINSIEYQEYFSELVQRANVLHIVLGSGMTGSINNAILAAEQVNQQSEHQVHVIDSFCSCGGYGLLCNLAANDRDNGLSIEETKQHILSMRFHVQHHFFTDDLHYFARTGRISSLMNSFANILDIFPLMKLNHEGKIIMCEKIHGKKNLIKKMVENMIQTADDGTDYHGDCYIMHADEPAEAIALRHAVEASFPFLRGKILIKSIGPIIGAHCGPGTVSLYYMGKERDNA